MKKTIIISAIILISTIIISCNKDKSLSKGNHNNISSDSPDSKEYKASLRLKVLDSVLKVMKTESPYPNDMEVISMKEVDSITYSEVAERSLRMSKGAYKGTSHYVDPRITPELKRMALDKSIKGYVLHYKIRYRVNDIRVEVQDCVVIIDAIKNTIIYSNNHLASHDTLVHELMLGLENFLLRTIK
ncbi:hypothetical protein [Flavobacterium sp.]|uniref:hypothetical protein n=1 Tax=Flavobacterium sp. TaxID=239 RepID=UPI002ED8C497